MGGGCLAVRVDKHYCVVTWSFLPLFRTQRYRLPSRTWPPTRPTSPSTRTTRGCSRSSTNWRPSSAPEQRGPVRDPKPSPAPQASVEMPVCESGGHTPKFFFFTCPLLSVGIVGWCCLSTLHRCTHKPVDVQMCAHAHT